MNDDQIRAICDRLDRIADILGDMRTSLSFLMWALGAGVGLVLYKLYH